MKDFYMNTPEGQEVVINIAKKVKFFQVDEIFEKDCLYYLSIPRMMFVLKNSKGFASFTECLGILFSNDETDNLYYFTVDLIWEFLRKDTDFMKEVISLVNIDKIEKNNYNLNFCKNL
jgi:hypothetical protein